MRLKKGLDWAAANELLHGVAQILEREDQGEFYNYVNGTRFDQSTQPEDLTRKVLEFLEQRTTRGDETLVSSGLDCMQD